MPVIPQQIKIDDSRWWHRRREGNGRNATACGVYFAEDLIPATRPFKLDRDICRDGCFSPLEIEDAEIDTVAKEDARYPADLPLSKRPSTEERRRAARRKAESADLKKTDVDLPSSDMFLDDKLDE